MKLAIVGPMNCPPAHSAVAELVKSLPAGFVVLGGEGRPVDKFAKEFAKSRGLETWTAPLDPKFSVLACYRQMEAIVKECDKMIAIWDVEDTSVTHGIRLAMMEKKLQKIITPFGVLRPEGP